MGFLSLNGPGESGSGNRRQICISHYEQVLFCRGSDSLMRYVRGRGILGAIPRLLSVSINVQVLRYSTPYLWMKYLRGVRLET